MAAARFLDNRSMTIVFCLRALITPCPGPATHERRPDFTASLMAFFRTVDGGARRRLCLMPLGSRQASADETSLVNLLAAAQNGAHQTCRAHALWIARAPYTERVIRAAFEAAADFTAAGITLASPAPPLCRNQPAPLRVVG